MECLALAAEGGDKGPDMKTRKRLRLPLYWFPCPSLATPLLLALSCIHLVCVGGNLQGNRRLLGVNGARCALHPGGPWLHWWQAQKDRRQEPQEQVPEAA